MHLPTTPVTALQRELRDEVRRSYPRGRVVVAVDGRAGAGTSTFAASFARVFAEDGSAVFQASIDDFHRPREERYALGRTSPEGYYRDSFDDATFRRVLVEPFREGARVPDTGFQLAAFDVRRDAPVESRWTTGPEDAVLVVHGIFLNRPELRGLWNWSVWLDVPVDVAFERLAARDGSDPDFLAESNRRYRLGMDLYLRDRDPRAAASAIVDNTDPAHPRRTFRDFC